MELSAVYPVAIKAFIPVFSAVACGMMVGFSCRDSLSPEERNLKSILLVYLFLSALGWFVTFCYGFLPVVFVWLNIACLLSYTLTSIFFYRIIRFLTRMGRSERFSPLHYLLPGALAAVMFVWSLFVPFSVQLEIVLGKAEVFPVGYQAYARFFTAKPLMRVVFGLANYVLTILVLAHYYKKVNGSDKPVRKPAKWVVFLVGISVASLLSSLLPTFMPRARILHSFWTLIVAFSIAGQHVLLSYHIIRRKYLLYAVSDKPAPKPQQTPHKRGRRHYTGKISRQRLENYFRSEKPHLNPAYRIADLVEAMDVNRTVLSAFINRTYGVSFPRYLNRWRLRELEQLRALSANKGKSISSLIGKTGFTAYRHYAHAAAVERNETASTKKGGKV